MSSPIRSVTLLLVFAALSGSLVGCGQAEQPPQPPVESLEEFLSRKVRSAKLMSLIDRRGGDRYSKNGPPPLTFRWTFGKDDFELKSTADALPTLVTKMLLGSEQSCRQIRGTWKLEMRDGAYGLLLQDLETDNGTTTAAVPLNLYHTAPAVIVISGETDAELMFQVDSDAGNFEG